MSLSDDPVRHSVYPGRYSNRKHDVIQWDGTSYNMMHFDSTGDATVLLFNHTAAVSETVQEP